MNAQEVFDTVACHLIKQGRPAVSPDNPSECMYRSPDGAMCAVGCLIPEDRYNARIEGISAVEVVEQGFVPHVRDVDPILFTDLQIAHDDYMVDYDVDEDNNPTSLRVQMENWKSEMKVIASRYNLSYAVLHEDSNGSD